MKSAKIEYPIILRKCAFCKKDIWAYCAMDRVLTKKFCNRSCSTQYYHLMNPEKKHMKETTNTSTQYLRKYFFQYTDRVPTKNEIRRMRRHKDTRELYKIPKNIKKIKKYQKDLNSEEIKLFRSEERVLRVIKYHLLARNGSKMPITDEMRQIVSKYLPDDLRHLLAQI